MEWVIDDILEKWAVDCVSVIKAYCRGHVEMNNCWVDGR